MKKTISMIIMSALLLSTFAACSPESTESSGSASTGGTTSTQSTASQAEVTGSAANVNPPGEFPIAKETVTFETFVGQYGQLEDYETNEFSNKVTELTNVDFVFNVVPASGVKQKLNVILSTNSDMPDIFLNANVTPAEQMFYGADQGMFVDLKPYISEWAPNIQATFDERPLIESKHMVSGGIYSINGHEDTYHVQFPYKTWINPTYLEALDAEVPTTTEEFEALLLRIKNEDPNGNGKADEIPYTAAIDGWGTELKDFMMGAFTNNYILPGIPADVYVDVVDGEIVEVITSDAYKEGLMYLKGLYDQGLLDPLAFTQTRPELITVLNHPDNIFGVVAVGSPGAHPDTGEFIATAVPPLEGPDGQQFTLYQPVSGSNGKFIVTNECEDIEAAVRFADYLWSEEGTLNSANGFDRWEYLDDPEMIAINGEQAVYKPGVGSDSEAADYIPSAGHNALQNYHWGKTGPQYMYDELRNGLYIKDPRGVEKVLYEETETHYTPVSNGQYLLPLAVKAEYTDDFVDISVSIEEYIPVFTAQAITGQVDLESEWPTFVASLENMGLSRMMEMVNESYIEQYGKVELWED